MYHLETIDNQTAAIIRACFPNYNGKKVELSTNVPSDLASYWDGGSRYFYCFYHLDTKQAIPVHSNHPYFESDQPSHLEKLPGRVLLVQHMIFCGKDLGIRIYANQSDLAPMLPAADDPITREQEIVLCATSSLKNTYGGRTDIRFTEAHRETGISADQWEQAKAELIGTGHLRKNGSITPKGRNAIPEYKQLHQLEKVG
jgi:hypothetical protein